ncbi:MAG: aminopeptidase [Gammaproteobacteria bacterium]|nr:aminopeptidase [Gammaproteobacteria bacterium]
MMPHQRSSRAVVIIAVALSQAGCYYVQAARGQYDVLQRSEPIDELLVAEGTPDELVRRLELVQGARQFAVDELLLPDNDSYRSYADLERNYVVWNVFAAPEFSLEPRTWCFPVAGCVAYRGYFDEQDAHRKAAQLRDDGFDVAVGGVPAYSTLGRFDDPVLNTMMRWQDTDLVATIFHELAHQVLYIKDHTAFNESFATAVADIGLERWLLTTGERNDYDAYLERRRVREQLVAIIRDARAELETLYDSGVDEDAMRAKKDARLRRLAEDLKAELAASGLESPGWLVGQLNNARLASIGLYELDLARFRALYEECARDLECFYGRAKELAE